MRLPKETQDWLLAAPEPYVLYQAQRLLSPDSADPTLLDGDPFIQANLASIANWRNDVLARHDKSDLFIHRLAMLADLGVTWKTTGAKSIIDDLLSNYTVDGSFLINIMIPKVFGGSGESHPDWVICDFPVVLYALLRIADDDLRLRTAVAKLIGLAGEAFYPCCGSIPKFKGPGPKNGVCPYANLLVARALAADPLGRGSMAAKLAAKAVLDHWTDRKTRKPFLFGMGTDFLKLKFPMVWYNLLSTVSALGGIDGIPADPRYQELIEVLRSKLDAAGRARPESVYLAYKTEEWSDKKKPSRLMTCFVHAVLERAASDRAAGLPAN